MTLAADLPRGDLPTGALVWAGLGVVALAAFGFRDALGWAFTYPQGWELPLSDWINVLMDWFVGVFKPVFRFLAALLGYPMNGLAAALGWLPWPATVTALAITGYAAGGWRLGLFTALSLLYMVTFGYWAPTMNTLALVFMTVPLSVVAGLFMGIAAFRSPRVERVVMPLLDVMQTFPTFAYLIPILFLFGFGPVVGLIASAIYAAPPMVRNVILGLRRVPPEIIESGQMSGATPRQLLWRVRLPSAMPQVMLGVNQTTMAAFSMVIIASVVGGSADIGWEVLSTMRKAQFGQSFLAGIVIALLAMVMDRISNGFAERSTDASFGWAAMRRLALGTGAAMVVLTLAAQVAAPLHVWPRDWVLNPAEVLNDGVNWIIVNWSGLLDAIKNDTLFYLLLPLRLGLENTIKPFTWGFALTPAVTWTYVAICAALAGLAIWRAGWQGGVGVATLALIYWYGVPGLPWPLFIAMLSALGWQVGGPRLAAFVAGGLLFILFSGFWTEAMRSVYLCGAAVLISFIVGAALGVLAALSDRFSAFVRPINDSLQTMPLFVFLIPVIMFFQIGDFPAMLAIIMYAIVPAIRYTEHGIRSVNRDTLEAARAQGCTRWQILRQVELPLALPQIMLGLNQTIIFAFCMLCVAALVGTKGLGQAVYIALNAGNVGDGMLAGLSMGILAMIGDRITQAWSAHKRAELGI